MPKPSAELWDKIDELARLAVTEYGETKIGFVLTQVAEIGRTYRARGIKQLYDAINFHCANLLSDAFGGLCSAPERPKKRVDSTLKSA